MSACSAPGTWPACHRAWPASASARRARASSMTIGLCSARQLASVCAVIATAFMLIHGEDIRAAWYHQGSDDRPAPSWLLEPGLLSVQSAETRTDSRLPRRCHTGVFTTMPVFSSHHARGIAIAASGTLLISFDSLLVRLADTTPWNVVFWRGSLICLSLLLYQLV